MKIAINCRSFLLKEHTGIGRYAFHLVHSLSQIDFTNEYLLYVQKGFFDTRRKIPKIKAKNFSVKWDAFNLGIEKTVGEADIYHSPSFDDLRIKGPKIIVTVHDLVFRAFAQGHTKETIATSEQQLKETVAKAERIICCSRSTYKDLLRWTNFDPAKLRLIYQGVERKDFYRLNEEETEVAARWLSLKGIRPPFLLFVGTIEPRKNLQNLLKAYSLLRHEGRFSGPLVVIGRAGWMSEDVSRILADEGLKEDVRFMGFVSNEELRYFYNLCEVFIFPSFFEGFGFPILEALSCGAAVVTSNVSSCPEVAGDAAILADPNQPISIAEAIDGLLKNEALKKQLQVRALKRAEEFSFEKTARETLGVYEEFRK